VGDDFKDNEKDDAKWGDDRSSTPGQGLNALTEIRRRMEYTASGHIASLRPWVAGVGSYTQDWAVAADVHLGNIALTENESHVQMGLFVCDNSDATNWYGLGVSGDYAYMMLDIYRGTNGVQERSLDGDCHVNAGGDEDLDLPHPPDDTASELVGVRIAFEAATKTLTIWYDADGIANGYTWIPYQSLRLGSTNWDMDATSTFSIGVLANSERHTVTSGDQVYVDNFRFRGSVPRAHVFFPDYLPADPVVYGKKVYEHTQYTNATDSISSLFTTELGGPVTVPYTSGAITGVVEKGSVLGAGSYFFNDGNVVKVLGQYDDDDSGQTHMYLTSSDANLTACPESQTFREVYDGALKPDCWWIREGRGGAPQAPVGDFSLIDIQDVTVGTNVYPNAVVGWEINVSRSFKSLNLHGLDAKLGIAFPTAAQALGCFVDGFIVFGRDNGVIANGWFDTNGILESLAVLQSVSRWPGVAITGPTNAPNYTSGTSLLTVSGTARDYDGVVSVSIRNNRDVAGFACSGTTNWFYTDLPVYQGKNTIEVIVTNATGNASTGTVVVTYTGDTNYQDVLRSGALVQKIEFPDNLTTGETVTVQWDVLSYVPIRSRVDAGVNGTESNKWSFFKYGQYKGSVASPWNLYGRKANVYSFECSWPVPQKPGDFSVWFNVAQMDGDQYMIPVIPEGVGSRIDPVRSKLITRTIMSVTTNDLVGPDPQSDDTNDHWAVDQAIETVEEHQRRSGATVTYVNMPTNLVQGTVTNCEWKILSYVDVNAQFLWINLTNKQVWATCNGRPVSSVGTTYNFVDRKDGTQRYANEYTFNADFMVPTNATPGDQQVFFRCQEAAFPTSSWMSANLSADIDPRQVRMNGMYGRFIERTLQVNVSTNAP
jgi:hypothetical protein